MKVTSILKLAAFLEFLAIAIGAFGAHGLKGKISETALETFQTGNLYHHFHALGLMLMALSFQYMAAKSQKLVVSFLGGGILLFSGGCYLYTITEVKSFAMIVPFGGVCFLISWAFFFFGIKKTT